MGHFDARTSDVIQTGPLERNTRLSPPPTHRQTLVGPRYYRDGSIIILRAPPVKLMVGPLLMATISGLNNISTCTPELWPVKLTLD